MEESRISVNSSPTAVQRTPAELWRMVLLIAVESPLRPRNGDDVLDGKIVFSTCCKSYRRFERIEALRNQLRLVCQAWNEILKEVGHHLAFIKHGCLKSIPFFGDESRKIRRIEPIRKYLACLDEHSVIPLEDMERVDSLLISNECRTVTEYRVIMKILDDAPRLRALELDDRIPGKYFTSILSHQALKKITHLSVGLLGLRYEGQMSFPAVQHLRLTVGNDQSRAGLQALPDWRFLSLTSFHLYRNDWLVRGGNLFEGLDHFIALHGKRITSLLIGYTTMGSPNESWPHHSGQDFWKWFPNLHLLGPGMGALRSLTPPPAYSKLTSLAIPALNICGPIGSNFPFDRYIAELLQACHILGVKRLIMTDLWEDISAGPAHKTRKISCWSNRLFERAALNGIKVFDSDRVPITDPKGERLLRILRDPTFSG